MCETKLPRSKTTEHRILQLKAMRHWFGLRLIEAKRDNLPRQTYLCQDIQSLEFAIRELERLYGEVPVPPELKAKWRI